MEDSYEVLRRHFDRKYEARCEFYNEVVREFGDSNRYEEGAARLIHKSQGDDRQLLESYREHGDRLPEPILKRIEQLLEEARALFRNDPGQ